MEELNEAQQNALSHFRVSIETALISGTEPLITESDEPSVGSHDDAIPFTPPSPFSSESLTRRRPSLPQQYQASTTSNNVIHRHHASNGTAAIQHMPYSWVQIFRRPLTLLYSMYIKVQPFLPWTLIRIVCSFVRSFWGEALADPLQELQDYCTYFDNQYGTRHTAFYRGKLSQALQDAKREVRLLFIYLHEKNSPVCERFCREVLCEEAIQNIIGNNLLWSASSDTQEGRDAIRFLHCNAYPCLCIIAHEASRQTVQLQLEAYNDADECLAAIFDGVQNAEHVLEHNRNVQNQRGQRDRLLEEQNAAYLESMRADQEKQKQKLLEENSRRIAEEEERRIQDERQKKLQVMLSSYVYQFAEFRDNMKASLPVEPSSTEPDIIQVSIRLPDNEPIKRRFRRNDPAKLLFEFAWTNEHVPDQFELLWGYPRRRYQYNQISDQLIKDVIVGNSETCYLEKTEESDS
ncbi:unnamed protein product [Didymodactylos carnosus]|uniref:UBX domain-containing protein n=1 Tax=Didymodactylos carnosus TaxID=1234261 RepID=A0A8S2LZX6_9BILA|nr:unnamed protein product [Didymodactylos carnosus]CAF3928765.1 unnamed protein product [Didymodactylos carnosus]